MVSQLIKGLSQGYPDPSKISHDFLRSQIEFYSRDPEKNFIGNGAAIFTDRLQEFFFQMYCYAGGRSYEMFRGFGHRGGGDATLKNFDGVFAAPSLRKYQRDLEKADDKIGVIEGNGGGNAGILKTYQMQRFRLLRKLKKMCV